MTGGARFCYILLSIINAESVSIHLLWDLEAYPKEDFKTCLEINARE